MIVEDSKPRGAIIHGMAKPSYEALDTEHFEFVLDLGGAFDETFKTVPIEVPPPRADETDAFAIAYTSGTTGKPKGVVLSHRSRVLTFFAMAAEYGCYGPDDTALCLAPMFHGAGLAFALAPIFFGGTASLSYSVTENISVSPYIAVTTSDNLGDYFFGGVSVGFGF